MGDALLAQDRLEEAHASYQAALRLAPRSGPAHAGLARLLRREGRLSEAVEEARRAARFQFRQWRYRELLAILLTEAGLRPEAIKEARAAARFAPPWEQDRLRAWVAELKAG
jgi:tetratricopeptide (TPR) repeat protein